MRIALFGQFGAGNSGNDGSLKAMVDFLKESRPDAELVCVCPNPSEITASLGIAAISSWRPAGGGGLSWLLDRLMLRIPSQLMALSYCVAMLRGTDMVIVPGTGFLDDFQERALGWPLMIFRWSLAARLAGARLAFVSIGAGPIRHPLSRRLMSWSARLCHYRSYRDSTSRDYMLALGSGSREDKVFPDLAFALPVPADRRQRQGSRISVGVGVMTYSGWVRRHRDGETIYETYLAKLVEFVAWLLDQGHDVRFLTGDVQDQAALWDILRRLEARIGNASDGHVTVQPTYGLHDLMEQIALTDIVVATRFHNVLCALKLARPVISLSYAAKNDDLLAQTGLTGVSQHVGDFDLDLLKRQFADALASRNETSRTIRAATDRRHEELAVQNTALLGLLACVEKDKPRAGVLHVKVTA